MLQRRAFVGIYYWVDSKSQAKRGRLFQPSILRTVSKIWLTNHARMCKYDMNSVGPIDLSTQQGAHCPRVLIGLFILRLMYILQRNVLGFPAATFQIVLLS